MVVNKNILLAILLAFLSFSCSGKEIENALKQAGLIEANLPESEEAWRKANAAHTNFCVELKAEKINIIEKKECLHSSLSVSIDGLNYEGSNNGEWGGNLSLKHWFSSNKVLISENVIQIVSNNNELYVFTGLSHMSTNKGAVYKITQREGSPNVEKLTLLPGAPEVVVSKKNGNGNISFIIITAGGLVSFDPENSELKSLVTEQFWEGLYSNSAFLIKNQLIVGMRSGVVVINLGFMSKVEKIQYFTK